MRIIVISIDRKLFRRESAVSKRFRRYGEMFDEIVVICFTLRKHGYEPVRIGENVRVLPTQSFSRFFYVFDAILIGRKLSGIDVVSASDPFETGLAGLVLSRLLGVPLQIQLHTDPFSEDFGVRSALNRIRRILMRHILPRADCIRVVSQALKEKVRARFPRAPEPSVLPIFVDIAAVRSAMSADLKAQYPQYEAILLMAHRLEPEKQTREALSALTPYLKAHPKFGLFILGAGSEGDALAHFVRTLGLSGQVHLLGWREEHFGYLKSADVFLNTSRYEGYGRGIVEALAAGCPVISTDVGVARESGAFILSSLGELPAAVDTVLARREPAALRGYPYQSEEEYLAEFRRLLEGCCR